MPFSPRQERRIANGIKRVESMPIRGPGSIHQKRNEPARLIASGSVEACDWDQANIDGRIPFMDTMPTAFATIYYPQYNDDDPDAVTCDWGNAEYNNGGRIFNPHPFKLSGYLWVTPINGIYIVDKPFRLSNLASNTPIYYIAASGTGTSVGWNSFSDGGWDHIAEVGTDTTELKCILKQTMLCRIKYNIKTVVPFTLGSADRFHVQCNLRVNGGSFHETSYLWREMVTVDSDVYYCKPAEIGFAGADPYFIVPNAGEAYITLAPDDVVKVSLTSLIAGSYQHSGILSIEPLYSF